MTKIKENWKPVTEECRNWIHAIIIWHFVVPAGHGWNNGSTKYLG